MHHLFAAPRLASCAVLPFLFFCRRPKHKFGTLAGYNADVNALTDVGYTIGSRRYSLRLKNRNNRTAPVR